MERALVLMLPVHVRLFVIQLLLSPALILSVGVFLRKTQPEIEFAQVYRIGYASPLGMLLSTAYALVAMLWVAHLLRSVAGGDRAEEGVA